MNEIVRMIIFGSVTLIITLVIQFILYKKNKNVDLWSETNIVFILCIIGILVNDIGYLASILGYVVGDYIGKFAGWHHEK